MKGVFKVADNYGIELRTDKRIIKNYIEMRQEGNVSKVAICNNCGSCVLACHVDFLNKRVEKEFTEFTNEGFTVKVETIAETKARQYSDYNDCINNKCLTTPKP